MDLSKRQEEIISIVKKEGPITGHALAERLQLTRSGIRPDLALLTMVGILAARPKVGYYYAEEQGPKLCKALLNYSVKDWMAMPVAVDPNCTIYNTIVTVFTEDVGTVLVCEGERLVGVVSRKDLLRVAIGQNDLTTMPVSMIMTPASKVITVHPDDTVLEAAKRLIEYEVDCLPVVEKGQSKKELTIVGRISKTSMTRLVLEYPLHEEE